MNRILITGAAGNIGRTLREGLRGRYPVLRLSDIAPMDAARAGEEIAPADLTDFAQVDAARCSAKRSAACSPTSTA